MIQRRQTVFMLLTAILSALLFFTPIIKISDSIIDFTIWGWSSIPGSKPYTWPLIGITILSVILPIYTIFIYKKRELQVKLCHLVMLLNVIFIVLVFLVNDKDMDSVTKTCSFGMFIPLANIVFEILAIRGIKKDIELLKSVDRLR